MKDTQSTGRAYFTLRDFMSVFFLYRKSLLYIFLGTLLVSIVIAFFIIQPVFLSSGTVKTSGKLGGGLENLIPSGLSDLGDLTELAGGSGSSAKELALYDQILTSRRCIEEAILKYNIVEEYNFSTMFDAVKYFREQILFTNKDRIAGTLEIGVFDYDPAKAKDMADFMIYQLNKINTEMNIQNAKINKDFLQMRYTAISDLLKGKEDSLIIFQSRYGLAPDLQVQVAARTQYETEAEIKSEEIKLEILRKILSPGESEIKIQEEKINAMRKELQNIAGETIDENILGLKGSPEIVMNYLRMRRELEIQNKLLTFVIPLLEQAKIEEVKETPTVIVLDPPIVPDKKSKPKRIVIVLVITLGIIFLVYVFLFIKKIVYPKLMSYK